VTVLKRKRNLYPRLGCGDLLPLSLGRESVRRPDVRTKAGLPGPPRRYRLAKHGLSAFLATVLRRDSFRWSVLWAMTGRGAGQG